MSYPEFFDLIPALTVHDPLAELLGAVAGGRIDYRYVDAVKLAGHSCPTVAGAWLTARHGLAALYPEGLAERGGIAVDLRSGQGAGTAGVTASVLGLITGAAGEGGFKGLGGRHVRRGLLRHGVELAAEVRFTRRNTGAAVLVDYYPERVPPDAGFPPLMARVASGDADSAERIAFARLWQERVRRILIEHGDDPELVVVRRSA